MTSRGFVKGDFKRVCDRTGFTVQASQTTKQWNGLIVRKDVAEPRHPQEFVRGRSDPQRVPDPRPRSVQQFLGALTTTTTSDKPAAVQLLDVDSSVRFAPGDHLGIILNNAEVFRVVLMTVPGPTQIEITAPLPWEVSSGNMITNYSAVALAEVD